MPNPELSDILTPAEAARVLRVSPRHVRRLIGRGELPAAKFGPRTFRIRRGDLLSFVTPGGLPDVLC